jgi:hypothetical protein
MPTLGTRVFTTSDVPSQSAVLVLSNLRISVRGIFRAVPEEPSAGLG